jgi:hypothetical protein
MYKHSNLSTLAASRNRRLARVEGRYFLVAKLRRVDAGRRVARNHVPGREVWKQCHVRAAAALLVVVVRQLGVWRYKAHVHRTRVTHSPEYPLT